MKIEELQKFCAHKSDVYNFPLQSPFSQDGMSWATDGHMIIGVPLIPGVPVNPEAPLISGIKPKVEPRQWFNLPDCEYKPCVNCKGAKTAFDCPECKGMGELYFKTEFNSYYPTCKSCDGNGKMDYCHSCFGSGVELLLNAQVGGVYFSECLLSKIKELPGIQIAPTDGGSPACLRFDNGGIGYIMPVRKG